MLVLSRRMDEAILIGDDIRVTVLNVKGNRVSIGIEAPAHVRITRAELESRTELELTSERRPLARRDEYVGVA